MNKLSNRLVSTDLDILDFIYFDSPYLYCLRDAYILISNGKRYGKKKISVGLVFMKGDKFVTNLIVFLIDQKIKKVI